MCLELSFICIFLPSHFVQIQSRRFPSGVWLRKEKERPASPWGGRGRPVQRHARRWFQQGRAAGRCFGMGERKAFGRRRGERAGDQMVHVLMPCGLEREMAVLRRKMKMAVKYLLEAIWA